MPDLTPEQVKELQEKIKHMSPEELKEFQKQQCIFCQIQSGNIPSKKVYEDERCFAILDINPANIGHLLLLPKEHYAIMPQVPEADIAHLFTVSKYLSQALLRGIGAQGTNIFIANGAAAGQRAQHFMLHVIPRLEGDGVGLELVQKEIKEEFLLKLKALLENKIHEILGIRKEAIIAPSKPEQKIVDVEVVDETGGPERKEEMQEREPVQKEKKPEKKKSSSLDEIAELFK